MFFLFGAATLGAYFSGKAMLWRSILALTAACIYPTYALITNVPGKIIDKKDDPLRWKLGVKLLLKMIGIVLIGALLVIGILSDPRYMLKIYQFSGVKLAYVFPILFVAWYYLFYPETLRSFKFIIRRTLEVPITLGVILLLGGVGTVFLVYLGRSGNFFMPVFDPTVKFQVSESTTTQAVCRSSERCRLMQFRH